VKRTAADIFGIAVETNVANASLTLAIRAAIDMIIHGAGVPKLVSSARTLWTRILKISGARTALLFPNILKGVMASTARSSVQRVLVVLKQWSDIAAQRARPFADVNWTELVVAFENVRDRPSPSPRRQALHAGDACAMASSPPSQRR
jgi:hypothetical protein